MISLAYKISHCLSANHYPELRCVICTGVTLFAPVLHFCTGVTLDQLPYRYINSTLSNTNNTVEPGCTPNKFDENFTGAV